MNYDLIIISTVVVGFLVFTFLKFLGNRKMLARPYSSETSMARKAYNAFGDAYLRKFKDDLIKMQPYINEFLGNFKPNGRILDIGCGGGDYVTYYQQMGFDAYGIDISDTMLRAASKKVSGNKLLKMDMHNLQFEKDFFDGVSSITVLQYTKKIKFNGILKQIYRVLKPGGKLFLVMFEGISEGVEIEKYNDSAFEVYTAYYTEDELCSLLKQAGFKITKSITTNILLDSGKEVLIFATK